MSPLPMPVRIAAGLAATAVEQVRELPRLVAEFPVTAVSQALQASMRVQQKVTELAIKGDRALGSLGSPPESPAWATFDDDVDDPAYPDHPADLADVTDISDAPEPAVAPYRTPNGHASVTSITPGVEVGRIPDGATEDRTVAEDRTVSDIDPASAIEQVAEHTLGAEADTPPAVLPGYPGMNLNQLRGKLRTLDLPGLHALLIWETSHENRPPFVTMLSNRITAVSQG